MARKKKKTGHVAIPFLITLLLGIVGMGGIALYVFNKIGDEPPEVKEMQTSITKPTAADNMTLLFILDEKEKTNLPTTFLVARVLPAEKKLVFMTFPENMLAVVNGSNDTLAHFYKNGGIQPVKDALADQTGIEIDRYIILDSESLQKICNIYGGVYYIVPTGTQTFIDSTEPQYLGPSQIEKLITYPYFDKGEIQRSCVTSDLLAEMVNLTDNERIVQTMDSNFRALINLVVETDITSVDYNDEKNALKYMYKYGNNIASFRMVTGEMGENDDVFMISDNFRHSVEDIFKEAPAPAPTEEAPSE